MQAVRIEGGNPPYPPFKGGLWCGACRWCVRQAIRESPLRILTAGGRLPPLQLWPAMIAYICKMRLFMQYEQYIYAFAHSCQSYTYSTLLYHFFLKIPRPIYEIYRLFSNALHRRYRLVVDMNIHFIYNNTVS